MRRSFQWTFILGVLLALTLGVAACGGDDSGSGERAGTDQGTPAEGKKGGKLTELWTDDTDNIDPGITYYQMGFQIMQATQKALYGYKPDDAVNAVPDLAESDPQISEDGKTVTVKIKSGVKFSPPVNREVTSKDVKYAIERGFFNTVNNGYAGAYFGDLEGAKVGAKPGAKIKGITTPDDHDDRVPPDQGHRRRPRRRARAAALGPGAGGVRGQVRQAEPVRVRPEPGRDRPVHDRERRVGQGDRLPGRPSASTSSATRTGTRALTSSRRTWTRSTCRRATTTPRWRRARSSTATA